MAMSRIKQWNWFTDFAADGVSLADMLNILEGKGHEIFSVHVISRTDESRFFLIVSRKSTKTRPPSGV